MGKNLTDETLSWTLNINGNESQKKLGSIEQSTRKLKQTNRDLRVEMQKMESQGKKNTTEYKQLEAQYKKNNTTIRANEAQMKSLRKEIGINALTAKQLRKRYRELKVQMDATTPNTPEWKKYRSELTQVDRRLKDLKVGQKKVNGLFGQMKTLLPALGVGVVVGLFNRLKNNIIGTRQEFEKYEAVLTVSLGSHKEARKEMAMIVDIASNTPFQVNELTNSYVKLTNYGLQPTREELIKIGDVTASVGKSFDQYVEAIADATQFEFERLKEFGIRASKQGDQVTFTFKGVETQVAATSQAVNDYLIGLGDMEGVHGSMDAISKTLGGRISNMKDNIDQLLNSLGKRGGGFFGFVIKGFSDIVKSMNDIVSVGIVEEFEKEQKTANTLAVRLADANMKEEDRKKILEELKTINPDIVKGLDAENISLEKLKENMKLYNDEMVKKITLANLEEQEQKKLAKLANTRAIQQDYQIKMAALMAEANADLALSEGTFEEKIKSVTEYLKENASGKIMVDNYGSMHDYRNEEARLLQEIQTIYTLYTQKVQKGNELEKDTEGLAERNKELKKILGLYDEIATGGKEESTAEGTSENTGGTKEIPISVFFDESYLEKKAKEAMDFVNKVLESPDDEEVLLADGQLDLDAGEKEHLEFVKTNAMYERELWEETYDGRLDAQKRMLEANIIAEKEYADNVEAIEREKMQTSLAITADAAGSIASIFSEQTVAYKFFASAEAAINTYLGATMALRDPTIPNTFARIAAMVTVIGTGLAQVAKINGIGVSQAAEGRYQVIGEDDGNTYNADYITSPRTGLYSRPTVFAETGNEIIIDPATTKNLQMNYPAVLAGIQAARTPQRAAGNYTNTQTTAPAQTAGYDAKTLEVMERFVNTMDTVASKGVSGKWTLRDLEEAQEKRDNSLNAVKR